EKRRDEADVLSGQHPPQLAARHRLDRLLECGGAAVVKIGSGDRDVTQAGHTEHMPIPLLAGQGVAAEIGLGDIRPTGEGVLEDAEFLEQIAADVLALMAGDAAIALEQLVAALRIAGDRVPLAAQIAVERRVGRQERSKVAIASSTRARSGPAP